MSKKFMFIFISMLAVLQLSSIIYANTWNRIEVNPLSVNKNQELTDNIAPDFIVGYSEFHDSDFSFEVTLDGAEWTYPSSGTLTTGITYSRLTKETLIFSVDNGSGSDEYNARYVSIHIPLLCKITRAGKIYVNVNGINTPISSTSTHFATCIDGQFSADIKKSIPIDKSGTLEKITIKDSSTLSYSGGTSVRLELNSGFYFLNTVTPIGTRKYENNVEFVVDENNHSVAYVRFINDTPNLTGSITLDGVQIGRNGDGAFRVVMMKATTPNIREYNTLNTSFAVAKYNNEAAKETEKTTKTEQTTEAESDASSASEAAEEHLIVEIQVGQPSMLVNGESVIIDAPAYISASNTMLPLRALANALNISDDSIAYNSANKTAVINANGKYVEITAENQEAIVDYQPLYMDAPATIASNRFYLPLRAVANIFGISNEQIEWNNEDKTVKITLF